MSVSDDLVQEAMLYASFGWQVVPIKPRGKAPIAGQGWQHKATDDEEQITEWWEQTPQANIGILLGKRSGIIDFEGDGGDAEKTMAVLFGGQIPPTPTYKSSRGKHRLFRWRSDLPEPHKNGFHVGDLEVRTGNGDKAAQSVAPPSVHESGIRYAWILHPSEVDVADVTDDVLAKLWNWIGESVGVMTERSTKPAGYWDSITEGVSAGERNQKAAEFIGLLVGEMKDPFNNSAAQRQYQMIIAWNERNRPPLPENELRRTFESILRRHRQSITKSAANTHFDGEQGILATPTWKLVIVKSKPRTYRLYSPLWSNKAKKGYIELTAAQMHSVDAIRHQALEQADTWVTGKFKKEWLGDQGKQGLSRRLVEAAEYIEAPLEQRRDLVIAEYLHGELVKASVLEEDAQPDGRGKPQRYPNGSIIFKFGGIWEYMKYGPDQIKRVELSKLLGELGCTDKQARVEGRPNRFKLIDREGLRLLGEMIDEARELRSQPGVKQLASEDPEKKRVEKMASEDPVKKTRSQVNEDPVKKAIQEITNLVGGGGVCESRTEI